MRKEMWKELRRVWNISIKFSVCWCTFEYMHEIKSKRKNVQNLCLCSHSRSGLQQISNIFWKFWRNGHLTSIVWFVGEMDHGGAVLWPHPPLRGGHSQVVCWRLHWLDDGPGNTQGLHASACGQGAQHVCPDDPQTPLQRLCTKVCNSYFYI